MSVRNGIQPILTTIKLLSESGKLGGILLILAAIISITITNSSCGAYYLHFWHTKIGTGFLSMSIEHWINDLLMAVFFFLVGMEIKREVISGELSSVKKTLLPMLAAIGGMLFPALIFFIFNQGTEQVRGWAIPTATDIAFSLGILSLLGNRVPVSLKIFLTALAIIDDLGGIIIIAVFYTSKISVVYLLLSCIVLFVLFLLNKFKAGNFIFYFMPMLFLWYFIYRSGIHATIAGVLSALFIPLNKIGKYEDKLHKPVNYLILPIFALVNTTIILSADSLPQIFSHLSLGIILALLLGKAIGITSFVYISIKTSICELPDTITIKHILGVSLLAGIGFTMSLFFTALSFQDEGNANIARLSIIIGSTLSAICGLIYLSLSLDKGNSNL